MTINSKEELVDFINTERTKARITIRELSEKTGYSPSTMWHLSKGLLVFCDTANDICRALGYIVKVVNPSVYAIDFNTHDLGQLLCNVRNRRKMTQDQLAEFTGIKSATITQYERSERSVMKLDTFFKVAKAFGWRLEISEDVNHRRADNGKSG